MRSPRRRNVAALARPPTAPSAYPETALSCRSMQPSSGGSRMKAFAVALALAAIMSAPALGENGVPQFQVDPFWPKPLPNNWILGQVSGIAVDRLDRILGVHRAGAPPGAAAR